MVKGIVSLASLSDSAINHTYALGGAEILSLRQMKENSLKLMERKSHLGFNSLVFMPLVFFFKVFLWVLLGVSPEMLLLVGFRYDAAPSIEEAKIDLGIDLSLFST